MSPAGVDIGSVLSLSDVEPGQYRFRLLSAKAVEFCAEVRALGDKLLSVLEKRDAEELALLRAGHETKLLEATRQVRKKQIDEAKETVAGSEQAKLQAEFEREKILILANASALEKIISAEGEASSRIIVANGTAESIRIIADDVGMNATELTNLFLTLETLKEIAKTTENFVVILGQDGLTYLIPLGQEQP